MNVSERWLADSVKYDIGGTMACDEEHIEIAGDEGSDSDEAINEAIEEMGSDEESKDNDEDNKTDNEADEGGTAVEQDQDNEVTDNSEGEGDGETHRDWREA
jgi:hypothetical protein